MNPILLIPARMASTRLPNKPLAEIAGVPMIVRVWARAVAAGLGPVVVAAGEPQIIAAVEKAGGRAVLTDPDAPSGSDRIWEALGMVDPKGTTTWWSICKATCRRSIRTSSRPRSGPWINPAPISALWPRPSSDEAEETNPAVVKAVVAWDAGERLGRALYFTRAPVPAGEGVLWHHVGLYAYRRDALESFVALPPSPLELREKLEQLRALEAGMRIAVARVDATPLSVDTPADLERARKLLS